MTGTIIRREGGFALIEFDGLVAERWVVSSSFPKHLSDNDTSGRYSNDTERVLQQLKCIFKKSIRKSVCASRCTIVNRLPKGSRHDCGHCLNVTATISNEPPCLNVTALHSLLLFAVLLLDAGCEGSDENWERAFCKVLQGAQELHRIMPWALKLNSHNG